MNQRVLLVVREVRAEVVAAVLDEVVAEDLAGLGIAAEHEGERRADAPGAGRREVGGDPEYEAYKAATPVLVPRPPRR